MTTTVSGSYPAVNSDSDATINGLTVGKGGGAISDNTAVGYQAGNTNSTGSANTYSGYHAGYFNTTSAVNAINFKFDSGNISSGTIKMYGVKKS